MDERPSQDQIIEASIDAISAEGEGVCTYRGYTLFVDQALSGEKVSAKVFERKKRYGRAKLLNILKSSPKRVKPPCPLFSKCGGCQVMHLDYLNQLQIKRQKVKDALERIGKLKSVNVNPCMPSPSPLAYRNKIQAPIREGEKTLRIGFNQKGSHSIVEVDFCHIHCKIGQQVYEKVVKILKNSSLDAYNNKTKKGFLRYLIIKSAVNTNQVLVVLVTTKGDLKEISEQIFASSPHIKGVVQSVNTKNNNVVLADHYKVLKGQGYIEDIICGLTFKVSPASFFQVNPKQAENLYQEVLNRADLTGNETVLDAYCGVGTLALIFAQKAKEVIGVECVPQAIEDARENAEKNKIKNSSFILSTAEKYIQKAKNIDLLILNPPRKGCDESLIKHLKKLKPPKILYISCDPATLARDLAYLTSFGFQISYIQPFDMFPQTAHVETLVELNLTSSSP